ncbi:hypothetical protein CR513_00407, partial [Mucuna pruriens]
MIYLISFEIYQETIIPISRSIEFADKFSNEIKDKTQLQRFLRCKKSSLVKKLPYLGISNPKADLIIETNASNIGYGKIFKQVVKYHSDIWHPSQQKYSTIKKEILSIVLVPMSSKTSKPSNKDEYDWNQHLFDAKSFSRLFNLLGYIYYDYIDAWFNTLYINPKKHSWFVWLKRGIPLKFPKWFVKWFYNFGPLPEIFPQNVIELNICTRIQNDIFCGFTI